MLEAIVGTLGLVYWQLPECMHIQNTSRGINYIPLESLSKLWKKDKMV